MPGLRRGAVTALLGALLVWAHGASAQSATTQVRLAWDQPTLGTPPVPVPWPAGVGARLYRQAGCAGAWAVVASVADANSRSVVDPAVQRGQRYCWQVAAFDAVQESPRSNTVDVVIPAALAAPGGVRVELIITVPLAP